MANYRAVRFEEIDPVACPCGHARRAFTDDPDRVASLHVVEITEDSRTHYHKRLTEIYYFLEGEGEIELDGERRPVKAGDGFLIKPGCRHRTIVPPGGRLLLLNVPVPAFDPEDEWFD